MLRFVKRSLLFSSIAFTGCGVAHSSDQKSELAGAGASTDQGFQTLETDFRFVIPKGQSLTGAQVAKELNGVLLSTFSLSQSGYQCLAHLSELQESGASDLLAFANLNCTATGAQKVRYKFLGNFIKKMSEKSGRQLESPSITPQPNIGVSN